MTIEEIAKTIHEARWGVYPTPSWLTAPEGDKAYARRMAEAVYLRMQQKKGLHLNSGNAWSPDDEIRSGPEYAPFLRFDFRVFPPLGLHAPKRQPIRFLPPKTWFDRVIDWLNFE